MVKSHFIANSHQLHMALALALALELAYDGGNSVDDGSIYKPLDKGKFTRFLERMEMKSQHRGFSEISQPIDYMAIQILRDPRAFIIIHHRYTHASNRARFVLLGPPQIDLRH